MIAFHFSFFTFHSVTAQELEAFYNQALINNPEISSMQANVEIARENINEVGSIPDTEFGFGYFVSEPETRTGAQKLRVSVRQNIPWFGTIQSRKDYAGALVSLEEADLEIAKRKLKLEVSEVYFDLYEMREKLEVLQENIELLDLYRTMALNSVETGKASAVEVLKLKMRQNDLLEQKKNLQLQIEALKARFNNILNIDEMTLLNFEDTLMIPPEKSENYDLSLHPELLRFEDYAESILKNEEMNQQESSPKLGFGLDYISVQERTDINFSDNGKDIVMPMVSVQVPIFNKTYRSVSKQNELKQDQITSDRDAKLNDLENRLETALYERNSARIRFNTQLDNLQQASNAEELLIKQYETGTIDFEDVLDIQEIQLKIQIDLVEAVSAWYQKDAVVNYLTNNTF
ncbi:TolC family protein [Gramella lutea]|uniref:TolC family protein n=2 Tax=Christiangramia lutea TaxID=1607951 RepID=A0A9X1V5K8_9FLAO|nr:TolC family protein [Christiangramia lutea]MCH4824521.1 TolC family protein [Christiangramia lutea]